MANLMKGLDTHKAAGLTSTAEAVSAASACPSAIMGGQRGHTSTEIRSVLCPHIGIYVFPWCAVSRAVKSCLLWRQ